MYSLLTTLRVLLALTGIGLAFGYYLYYAGGGPTRRKIFAGLLIFSAVLGIYLHLELGPQFRRTKIERVMNPHDFYHYYIGSKYFRELGYFDIYECSLVADRETDRWIKPDWSIRDLRIYRHRLSTRVDGSQCKENFTPARWKSFKNDVVHISHMMTPHRFNKILKDKGYNATPVWTMVAARLTNLVPVGNTAGLYWLMSLDWLLMLGIFAAVGWAFGWRSALFAALFWGVNVMSNSYFVKGSLLRLDWLACVVLSLCLIRKGRYLHAGIFAGLAASLRIFPVLFLAGLGAKMVYELVRTRTVPRHYVRFFAATLVTIALLVGVTSLTQQGRERWGDFKTKITGHDRQIAGYRVGLKYALLDVKSTSSKEAMQEFDSGSTKRTWWLAQLLMAATVFVAAQRLKDHQTLALSFVCVFFLTAPTFYYYQMLIVPFLLFLPAAGREGRALGMAGFFGWCVLGYVFRGIWPLGFELSHWLSWSLFALCAFLILLVFTLRWKDEPAESVAA